MLKALVVKELRESAGIVALAVLGAIYMLGELTATPVVPWQSRTLYTYPFVGDWLAFYMWLVAGGLAIALGLRQTAWELGQGTYFFLLHRPVRRGRIFGLKLLIGGSLAMVFSALLILIYAWWAATPGHFAAPFEWSMTRSAWIQWISLLPIYIGAFLSGIRPGRWFGTRLVPLFAGLGAALLASIMPWFWAAMAVSFVATAFGLVGIFYYVRQRDF
jgi:hypothetical protein